MKKAQIQSSETIFAVVIITIIVMIALVFYSRVAEGGIKEKAREDSALRLVSLAHTISAWPELECSVIRSRDFNCVDKEKLKILKQFIDESKASDSYAFRYYTDILRRSKINITEVYSSSTEESWIIYDASFKNATSTQTVFIPINIYDPVSQKYSFGKMELTVYE